MNEKRPEYLHVLHLTPCERFIWNKLRSNSKKIDNQYRIAIPAQPDDLYLQWDVPNDLDCDENHIANIVHRFCAAGIIIRLGDSEEGKVPYRFIDDPRIFYINPIDERPKTNVTPEFKELALSIMGGDFEENPKSFQPDLIEWIKTRYPANPKSAYVKLVGVRFSTSPAVGVFFPNPNWSPKNSKEKLRYLIAAPGFTAYELVAQTPEELKKKRKKSLNKARQKSATASVPVPTVEQFAEKSIDELQKLIQKIGVDILELEKMLELKNNELLAAQEALKLKLDAEVVARENELRRLKAMRQKMQD